MNTRVFTAVGIPEVGSIHPEIAVVAAPTAVDGVAQGEQQHAEGFDREQAQML